MKSIREQVSSLFVRSQLIVDEQPQRASRKQHAISGRFISNHPIATLGKLSVWNNMLVRDIVSSEKATGGKKINPLYSILS